MVRFSLRIHQAALAAFLLLAGSVDAGVLEKLFVPKSELWARWSQHDEANKKHIDHGAWDGFLQSYGVAASDGITRFAYGRVGKRDLASLSAYVTSLSTLPITSYSRSEQLAYWINLYNALTVKTVLEHYPVKSIRDIDLSGGLFADGPWRKKLVRVEGEPVSLDDIEHRILRPIWKDPRVHYAVNCASIGCPNLQLVAFTAKNAEALLNRGARDYVNHPRGARVEKGSLILSSIYSWFEVDFAADGGVLAHIERYADPLLAAELEKIDRAGRYEYDWSLNDAQTR